MAKRRRHTQQIKQTPHWPMIMSGIGLIVAAALLPIFWLSRSDQNASPSEAMAAVSPTPQATPAASSTPKPTLAEPQPTPKPSPTIEETTVVIDDEANIPQFYSYEIVNTYPHDRAAFTQGLIYEAGILYEGTGLNGESSLRKVDLGSGQVIEMYALPDQYFGEGITIFDDRLIQLTWQSRVGFVYDKESFELLEEFTYPTEGCGITHDDQYLIMSDGSANLYFWHPETFAEVRRLEVQDRGEPVRLLNELEYINGEVYANVWKTTRIARISPETGQVLGWIELDGLLRPEDLSERTDVLNGIAYDAETERLFVTGKWWPKLFEIELTPLP